MPKYEVIVSPNSMRFIVVADTEDGAIELAKDLAHQENQYDILKWADYEVEESK